MRRGTALVLAAAFVAGGVALVVAAGRGAAPPGTMDERVRQIASTLRCPVCADLSVADSPSIVARQIRSTIEARLRRGRTPAEIRAFFVSRFGTSILLRPSGHGIDLVAWLAPAMLVLAGLAILGRTLVRWSGPRPAEGRAGIEQELSADDRALLDREIRALDTEAT
jgi:cytochrome c-type biogenesis protein CcmH